MALVLYNSGSKKKEVFVPLKSGHVSLYVCGVTPYDTTHLGHAFTYVTFDVLIRYLKSTGLKVDYVQNVTDIDDDILRKAKEQNMGWKELGEFWTKRYLNDMKSINVLPPTHYVKATDSIPHIIRIVSKLQKESFAYKGGSNVYFNTKKFPGYGALSHFNEAQMLMLLSERGGNINDPKKKNKLDFIVWQGWKEGEPYWDSPWGRGRPGWHIECSAMINEFLGDQIDLHGGGRDLIFPHHESEIAQSESFTGKHPFSRFFLHTAMVMYMGEKMSKSLGNLVLVSQLLKSNSPNAIRWMLLSNHYRKVWEYEQSDIEAAEESIASINSYLAKPGAKSLNKTTLKNFAAAMEDDLDTPAALEIIKKLVKSKKDQETARAILDTLGFVL